MSIRNFLLMSVALVSLTACGNSEDENTMDTSIQVCKALSCQVLKWAWLR